MSIYEIEGMIFKSCRNDKPISFDNLSQQIVNWGINIKHRKYPYKFQTLQEFEDFAYKLKQQLIHWDIPIEDVRIQGSSLSTPNAKDVDVAIMINESQLEGVKAKIIERYKKSYVKNGKPQKKELEDALKLLNEQIDKGYIKNRQFGLLEGQAETFMQELYELRHTYPQGRPLDISIIIKERNFDTPPYLKI